MMLIEVSGAGSSPIQRSFVQADCWGHLVAQELSDAEISAMVLMVLCVSGLWIWTNC